MTQEEQIISALRTGPKSVWQIREITGMPSGSASRACQMLISKGLVDRIGGSPSARIYALSGTEPRPKSVRAGLAEEGEYIALRAVGVSATAAAHALSLSGAGARRLEAHYRACTFRGSDSDSSTPKFSDDELHIELVAAANFGRGFPAYDLPARRRIAA